jgi:uncharacterized protein YndB with AHSA1/START domain
MDAQLEQRQGGWQLRFVRKLPHPVNKVWTAITEPEHLKAWFPDQIVVKEWKPGAALKFITQYGDFDGEVLTVQPPRLLELRWGTDFLRFELAPDGEGSVLTLIDRIDQRGKAARDAAGWDVHLEKLVDHLAGRKPGEPSVHWQKVHPHYVEKFGPEAATIGPPAPVKQH